MTPRVMENRFTEIVEALLTKENISHELYGIMNMV